MKEILIIDDPVKTEPVTPEQREAIRKWYTEKLPMDNANIAIWRGAFHEDSLYERIRKIY